MWGFRELLIATGKSNIDPLVTPLTFIAVEANSSVTLNKTGSPSVSGLQYRLGTSGDWLSYTTGTAIPLSTIGDSVQFQNTANTLSTNTENLVKFAMSGKIKAFGNIQSLLNWSTSVPAYGFYSLFDSCSSLVEAPTMPAETLNSNSCNRMYLNCTGLTQTPELPATTVNSATYAYMFAGCSNLKTGPTILPAMTLYRSSYAFMFRLCSSLTKPPILPATSMDLSCYYQLFYHCTSLVEAPALPATTLATSCYYQMFRGCSSLNKIEVNFTTWSAASRHWVNGVAASGTFIKPSGLAETYGVDNIPTGWTVVDKN